jgi:hypothetical protein
VVSEVVGLGIRVRGLTAAVGELVTVHRCGRAGRLRRLPAQVVAVHADGATCLPLAAPPGCVPGTR